MIEWKPEHLIAFIDLTRAESAKVKLPVINRNTVMDLQNQMTMTTQRLQLIQDAANGDDHAQNNIMQILIAREVLDAET